MRCKKIALIGMSVVLAVSLCGCSSQREVKNSNKQKEIKIPMILTVNPSTGKKNEEDVVTAFNEEYDGRYEVDVEWIVQTEEEYRTNLKRLNVTDELPAIITELRLLPSFYQMMVKEGRIENLYPYIYEDQEWKEMIEPVVLNACTQSEGKIYLAPLSTAFDSCSGVFWNEELFRQAGIEEFPQTWEGFWDCCEKLKDNGITPLALHTEGTAWAPMLLATAELADTESGARFMDELYPQSYQNENGIHLANTLKRLFAYTTEDAMYNDFDVSYENFISGRAAIIPNGHWMIEQIPEEIRDHIRFSPFPGNKLICSPETFGWAVISKYSDKVKEGAIAFLKYRTSFNLKQKEAVMNVDPEKNSRLLNDYIHSYTGNPQIVPNYQVKWNSVLQEETLGEYIPKLVKNQMTEEEFVQKEDESVRRFNYER